VTTLRQRQQEIRTCLNIEASEIRILESLIDCLGDSTEKSSLRKDVTSYTIRIINECASEDNFPSLELANTEMSYVFDSLNKISQNPNLRVDPGILSQAYAAVVRLNSQRSTRISSIQANFPLLHYSVLATLAMSICVAFLLETNQKQLVFLAETELRFLWTILIGAFSALWSITYDLLHPFRGNYQILLSVVQFYKIRDSLIATERAKQGMTNISMSSSIKIY